MIFLVIFLLSVLVTLGAGVLSGWSDYKGLTIPNRYPLIVLAAFVPAYGADYFSEAVFFAPLTQHLLAAALVFVLTFIMFLTRIMGGGDSKLLTAFGLWTGMAGLPALLLYMAVFGGIIGLAAVVIKKTKPFKAPPADSWVGQLQQGKSSVPYGIAITGGAFVAFLQLGYLDFGAMFGAL